MSLVRLCFSAELQIVYSIDNIDTLVNTLLADSRRCFTHASTSSSPFTISMTPSIVYLTSQQAISRNWMTVVTVTAWTTAFVIASSHMCPVSHSHSIPSTSCKREFQRWGLQDFFLVRLLDWNHLLNVLESPRRSQTSHSIGFSINNEVNYMSRQDARL